MDTIVKLRVIGQRQQMLRVDFENDPSTEVLTQMLGVFKKVVRDFDAVIFSDYAKGGLTHIPTMIGIAKKEKKLVFVDPKGNDWIRYKGATVITPNRAELAQVIGNIKSEKKMFAAVRELLRTLDLTALLLTRSEDGMTLIDSVNTYTVSTRSKEVSDVTGAGDTVIATMAVMSVCGKHFEEATEIANKAAGIVVTKLGTSAVTYEELCS